MVRLAQIDEGSFRLRESTVLGTPIRWWEHGPDKGPTIVFLHGFRGNHRGLMWIAQELPSYRFVLPDLPGWGESGRLPGRHTFANYTNFLDAWLHAFPAPIHLAGHSFGASMAIVYAGRPRVPISTLTLLEPVLRANTFTSHLGEVYYQIGAKLPSRIRDPWIKSATLNRLSTELITVVREPTLKKRIVHDEQANLVFVDPRVEIESFLSFYEVDFLAAAQHISVPTSLIVGGRDRMTPISLMRSLAGTIPRAQLRIMAGAGHFAPMEIPHEVARELEKGFA